MNAATAVSDQAQRRDAALALANAGRLSEAEHAYRDLLRDAPEDIEALNYLAVCAHGRGERDAALEMLERAARLAPGDAPTLINLGTLQREHGRLEEAYAAMKLGTDIAPHLFAARLRLGEILQALGRHADAVPVYFGAINVAQARGQWLSDATTPVELQPLVKHAMRIVAGGRRGLFLKLLQPLRERHGAAALVRVEKALAIYLDELQPTYPDPAQRPLFLYFPDLPAPRVFPRELFPWYGDLEAQTDAIRTEMLAVLTEDKGFEPFLGHVDDPQALQKLLGGDGAAPAWNAFFFYRHGARNDANMARCPRTTAAIEAAPLCRVRDHAPEVCFSVLTPGSHIRPHRGVTNTRLVTHLALVVPDHCALEVSGHTQTWQEGKCFSFDDTFEHEAYNRSSETRVVMLMDVWNPYMTEVERDATSELIGAIGDFNRAAGV